MDIDRRVNKRIRVILCLFVLLGAAIWGFERYFVFVGKVIPKDAARVELRGRFVPSPWELERLTSPERIDLRGSSVQPYYYDRLRQRFPQCEILYELPFQGEFLPLDTRAVHVTKLTKADVKRLEWLEKLDTVLAEDCRDYDALLALAARPGVSVTYNVEIGDQLFPHDAVTVTVVDGKEKELTQKLAYLPQLRELELVGKLPDSLDGVYSLFPELCIRLLLPQGKLEAPTDGALDVSGWEISAGEIRAALRLLPGVERLRLPASLDAEDVCLLCDDFPDTRFPWNYPLYGKHFSTEAGTINLSGTKIDSIAAIERALECFPELSKVEMCGCGVDNETMDALNRRHPEVRFIWQVQCGPMTVRTDATYFMPTKYGVKVHDGDMDNLRFCPDMVCVDLGHMPITKTDFLQYLPNVEYLVLADTRVSDISNIVTCKKLLFLELFMTNIRDVSYLKELTQLEDLNLCYTPADPSPIGEMTWLHRLWWSGRYGNVSFLRGKLPDTQTNFTTGSSTGAGWREGKRYYEMRDILHMPYFHG